MRRLGTAILLLLGLLLAAAAPAHAQVEKRLALLIGNQAYSAEIGKLANPHNDIALMERTLKGLQFEVATVRDANLGGMHQAVNAYARRVKVAGPGAVAFFYYAGHGASDAGTNYLIPVDVKSAEQGDLWDVSLRLTEVTRKLKDEAGNAVHFVVLDACRNTLKLRAAGTRALVQSRGFVPVAQESGMLVAYATAEGELASDVGASAGPYASALAEEIVRPGVEAVTMFRNVQLRVKAAIGQEPWIGFTALGRVHLAGLAADPPNVAPSPKESARMSEAAEAWAVTKDATSIAALEAFVRRFGDTYYGDLAKMRLDELRRVEIAKEAAATKKKIEDDVHGPRSVPKSIAGTWVIRREGDPFGRISGTYAIEASGSSIFARGPDWSGRGFFDGKTGYYDWVFPDGRRGRTTLRLDSAGVLHGQVRGPGADLRTSRTITATGFAV